MNSKARYIIYTAILLAIITFSFIPFSGGDNFHYFLLSKSILQQGNFRELWTPGNPLHGHFPPVLPILLLPATITSHIEAGKLVILTSFVLLLFAYMKFVGDSKKPIALGALVIFAFAPILREYSHYVLTEIPYTALLVFTLLMLKDKKYKIALLLSVIAFYMRSIGVALFATVAIVYFIDNRTLNGHYSDIRKWKWSCLALVAISLWFIYTKFWGSLGSYSSFKLYFQTSPYSDVIRYLTPIEFFQRILFNIKAIPTMIFPKLFGHTSVGYLFFGCMFVGIWKNKNKALRLYTILHILLFLAWPLGWDYRYYIPLLPIFSLWIAEGLYSISLKIIKDDLIFKWIVGLFALGNILQAIMFAPQIQKDNIMWTTHRITPNERKYAFFNAYMEADKELRNNNTPKNIAFITRKPAIFYYFTGYKGVKRRNSGK